MAWRFHGRATVDPANPRAFGFCDRCGFLYNLDDLQWQYQYVGTGLQNLRILVCDTCLDVPQPQLQVIILPPDPPPVFNARPEPYALDEIDYLSTQLEETIEAEDGDDIVVDQPSQNFTEEP